MKRIVLLVTIVLMMLTLSGCCTCCNSIMSSDASNNSNNNNLWDNDDNNNNNNLGDNGPVGCWSDVESSGGQYVSLSGDEGGYITNVELGRQIIFNENGEFNDTVIDASLWGGFMNIQTGDYRVDGDQITFSNVQVKSIDDQSKPDVWTTRNVPDYTATYTTSEQDSQTTLELTWSDGNTTTLHKC